MGFLTPAFLIGLVAVAAPVVIHLVNRERRQTLVFPSLMFLSRVPHRSVRRRRVRHWLLLALRVSALALLSVAFARPLLTHGGASAVAPEAALAKVVVVDRSYSMGYGDHWPRAVAAAEEALADLAPQDVAGLVFFGERAEATGALAADRRALEASLDRAELGWEGTRFAPALKIAARLLEEAGPHRRELLLVSDFQEQGLEGLEDVGLPEGTQVRWIDVSEPAPRNLGITDVTLHRVYERDRERVALGARVVAQGEGPPGPVGVTLELGGQVLETRPVDLAGNSAVTVRFDPVPFPRTAQRALIRLEPDALPHDDVFRFVLEPGRDLGVLIVERNGARRGESLFLRRALAIGDRPRFEVRVRSISALMPSDLAGTGVVVLNDTGWPTGGTGEALRAFVERGGGVVAALASRSRTEDWAGPVAGVLPGTLEPRATDRSGDWGGTLAYLDYDHPVFELFSRPRSGDFSEARFQRYRTLNVQSANALARFDDGTPALLETPLGEGRIFFWTSSLDTLWNDLPLQPVFLPFLHRLLATAATHVERPAWRRVGDVLELPSELGEEWIGQAPGGVRLGPTESQGFVTLEAAGFYELRRAVEGDESREPLTVAVNVDAGESDLTAADPEEVASRLGSASGATAPEAVPITRDDAERRQGLWWFLLLGALAILGAETVLSNRLSQVVR